VQIDGVHQVMQGYVGIAAAETRQKRGHESSECNQRIVAEGAEKQIEPDHIRFLFADRIQDSCGAGRIVK
jgi:hypothetical protein